MRKKVNLINAILYAVTAVLWLVSYPTRDINQNRTADLLCAAVWAVGAGVWWIRWRRELE